MTIQSNDDFERSIDDLRQAPTVKPLTQSKTFRENGGVAGLMVIIVGYLSTPGGAELIASVDPRLPLFITGVVIPAWNVYRRSTTTSAVALTRKRADAINQRVEVEVKEAARKAAVGVQDTSIPFGGHEGTGPLSQNDDEVIDNELTYEPIEEKPAPSVHKAPTEPLKNPTKEVSKKPPAQPKRGPGRPKGSKNGKKKKN